MTKERYRALMEWDSDLPLTREEIAQGWHFCPEFDGLLRSNLAQEPGEFECDCLKQDL